MYSLLEDPIFAPALKYDPRSRIFISESLQNLYQELESLQQTSDEMKDNLRTRCAEVQAYITTIPFVREITKPPPLKRNWMMLSQSERAIALRAGISDME
jgi:hypothetical protein